MKTENKILEMSFDFALETIAIYRKLIEKKEYVLSKQLLRSGTSIGANVEEAIAAQSRKDFISKMCIASKESRETRYWIRLLDKSKIVEMNFSAHLEKSDHIINILTKIVKTTAQNPASKYKIQNTKFKIELWLRYSQTSSASNPQTPSGLRQRRQQINRSTSSAHLKPAGAASCGRRWDHRSRMFLPVTRQLITVGNA